MSLARLRAEPSCAATASVKYKIAASREERASAFRLVYRSYLEAQLGGSNRYGMRVTPYHLLPSTEIFLATLRGETIFTVTLIGDGELGLPMETVYGEEVERRRRQGLALSEVSCLADRRAWFRGFFPIFVGITRLMAQYARRRGFDELLVAVHPKHARFYRRYMDFEVIGEERAYPTVRNNPAVALSLNFDRVDRDRPRSYNTFFGRPIADAQLEPRSITASDRDYFGEMVEPGFCIAPLLCIDELSQETGAPPDCRAL